MVTANATQADPLPSWNDGEVKRRILTFVQSVAEQHGPDHVPAAARIAVFDNDGTLWCEQPLYIQGSGRDHNPEGFLIWMAGGGIKGGYSYGNTDEIGYKAVENPVSVHDVHATILHLLGMDHKRLTYLYNGRRFRLTDVAGNVIHNIIA